MVRDSRQKQLVNAMRHKNPLICDRYGFAPVLRHGVAETSAGAVKNFNGPFQSDAAPMNLKGVHYRKNASPGGFGHAGYLSQHLLANTLPAILFWDEYVAEQCGVGARERQAVKAEQALSLPLEVAGNTR
jgi:hypothetical protein